MHYFLILGKSVTLIPPLVHCSTRTQSYVKCHVQRHKYIQLVWFCLSSQSCVTSWTKFSTLLIVTLLLAQTYYTDTFLPSAFHWIMCIVVTYEANFLNFASTRNINANHDVKQFIKEVNGEQDDAHCLSESPGPCKTLDQSTWIILFCQSS